MSLSWRALKNPDNVARVLFPDERNLVKDFLMYDRCTKPGQYCRWHSLYAGSVRKHVCTGVEWECRYKQKDYYPPLGPTYFSLKPDRDYKILREWCEEQIEDIAQQDDFIGAIACAWLLEDWSAVDLMKPQKTEVITWRIEQQKRLYKEISKRKRYPC